MLPRPLAIGITILISFVWAANVVVGFIFPDRHDATINAIFAIVVGAVYGLTPKKESIANVRRRLGQRIAGDSDDDPPQPRGDAR